MKTQTTTAMLFIHLLLTSAIFGFFYSYSCSVMIGLDFADGKTAITAMQAINATIKNPWFAPAFFGPLVTGLVASLLLYKSCPPKVTITLLVATGIYFLGAFLPTMLFSVPMNDKLALVTNAQIAVNPEEIWQAYSVDWKFWNLIRTIASAISVALIAFTFLQYEPTSTSATS